MDLGHFTKKELQDVVRDMGQNIDEDQLSLLKKAVEDILREDYGSTPTENQFNESIFSSLCVDDVANQPTSSGTLSSSSPIISRSQSPIAVRRRSRNGTQLKHIADPGNFQANSIQNEAEILLNDAYRSMDTAYDTCRFIDGICKAMQSTDDEYAADFESEFSYKKEDDAKSDEKSEEPVEDEEVEEEKENEVESVSEHFENKLKLDPSIRPVLCPKPGQAPFKYDPVTRYHLYKEEWDRHPAPGEKKRLALRWKVREFMLRHDAPRLNAVPAVTAQHAKDWSPRPYLD